MTILVSDLVKPWITWSSQTYLQLYGLAAISSVALFYLRARSYYERRLELAAVVYAFFDVIFVLGLLGIIHFGMLLPILDPSRMARLGGIKVGFNEVLLACLVMLAIRPSLQLAIRGQERRRQLEFLEIQRMISLLENISRMIEQISRPLHERGDEGLKRHLDILLERIDELRESMMVRAAVYAKPVISQHAQVLEPKKTGEAQVEVVRREAPATTADIGARTSLPDAAIDNPWMEVLRGRKRK